MQYENIVKAHAAVAQACDIRTFTFAGWNCWPVLKTWITWEVLSGQRSPSRAKLRIPAGLRPIGRRLKTAKTWAKERFQDPAGSALIKSKRKDIVFISPSSRRIPLNGKLYDPFSDPLVECLREVGLSHVIWEYESPRTPRHTPSAWISNRLELASAWSRGVNGDDPPAPAWFADFAVAAGSQGLMPPWPDLAMRLRKIELQSRIIEDWLTCVEPKLVLAVPWFHDIVFSIFLAAHRLGIPTYDFQHGIFSPNYRGWRDHSGNAFELCPKGYWVWGDDSRRDLELELLNTQAERGFLVGGNLWLNKWKSAHDGIGSDYEAAVRERLQPFDRVILVTMQPFVDIWPILEPAILRGPSNWLWLIRQHPRMTSSPPPNVLKQLSEAKNVDMELATQAPLYLLFKHVQYHVSGFSTTAAEALAFAIPTILLHPMANVYFHRYLSNRSMWFTQSADELLDILRDLNDTSRHQAARQSQHAFQSTCSGALEAIAAL